MRTNATLLAVIASTAMLAGPATAQEPPPPPRPPMSPPESRPMQEGGPMHHMERHHERRQHRMAMRGREPGSMGFAPSVQISDGTFSLDLQCTVRDTAAECAEAALGLLDSLRNAPRPAEPQQQ